MKLQRSATDQTTGGRLTLNAAKRVLPSGERKQEYIFFTAFYSPYAIQCTGGAIVQLIRLKHALTVI